MTNPLTKIKLNFGVNPKLVLKVLRSNIEDAVKHPVEKFEMQFHSATKKIDFIVFFDHQKNDIKKFPDTVKNKYLKNEKLTDSHLYAYPDGTKLVDIITNMIKKEIPKNWLIDYVVLRYDENTTHAGEIYVNDNGVKTKLTFDF